MKQILTYGSVTPLREFELPEKTTPEDISVNGMKETQPSNYYIATSTSLATISRVVQGNCASTTNITVEAGAHVKIVETITGSGSLQAKTIVTVEPNAYVEYDILQDLTEDSVAILHYEAHTKESSIQWLFCGFGADTTQVTIKTIAGEHSVVKNHAVICGTGQQQFDIHVATEHQGSHSTSDMLTRSVLDDSSRATYHGLIRIGPESGECDSYQKDEVILLSDKATADAIPNLEIRNNTVRCTHGVTIGKVDEEKLFYLKTRGISDMDAKRIITEGFLNPLTLPAWQPKIREKISRS